MNRTSFGGPAALRRLGAGLACLGLSTTVLAAQPLTERTPGLEGTWVTPPHSLYFQFSHRFEVAGRDVDIADIFGDGKVVNYPTFAMSYGLTEGAHLGFRYSSNSLLAGEANEWQPFFKVTPLRDLAGGRLSVGLLGAWNAASSSFDGELSAQGDLGPLTLIAAARGFSDPFDRPEAEKEAELAFAGGAVLALNRYLSLSADYANMVTQPDAQIAWSAGLNLAIPHTPHTLGLFATNVVSGTLQGLSVGLDGSVFWGFEFTIPFTGARWRQVFSHPPDRPAMPVAAAATGATPGAPAVAPAPSPRPAEPGEPAQPERAAAEETPAPMSEQSAAPAEASPSETAPDEARPVVEIAIAELEFGEAELRVTPGTTVRWVNRDPFPHTATAVDGSWSSPLLEKDGVFELTFDDPGRYEYMCAPHPFMKAAIVVEEGAS